MTKTFKRAVQRFDQIYALSQILLRQPKSSHQLMKSIKNEDILNFYKWWPQYLKKTAIDIEKKGEKFSISQYRHLVYKSQLKGYVKASNFIDSLLSITFKLNKIKKSAVPRRQNLSRFSCSQPQEDSGHQKFDNTSHKNTKDSMTKS